MSLEAALGILLVVTIVVLAAIAVFSLIFGIDFSDIFGENDDE